MKWFVFIILFLAAIVFGFEMAQDPGYALFVYHDWMVQMPLWFALLILVFLLFFVVFFTRVSCGLMFLKRSLKLWWLERRFRKNEIEAQKKRK